MEYSGVYMESSVVDLKPRVLDFLTKIVDKAKEVRDYAISFKKAELAELSGIDTRTATRYLKELEEKKIIQMKGVRGRSGGTVVMFNTELIRFETSGKALVNSDEPISIDDIANQKLPKKQKEPKNNKRNRRTKKQMVEAKLLNDMRETETSRLNSKLEKLGTPNWEWFKETKDPVANYRTYIISRLYNRYAVLFTDRHNAEVDQFGEGGKVPTVSDDYDVLPTDFYGSPRWQQFEKFRMFCEENGIDPAVYLSAQFNRSVFDSSTRGNKKMLPFVNTLSSDSSYEVFKQYCGFQKKYSKTYASYQQIPAKFVDDFVVKAMIETYYSADKQVGLLQYSYAIHDFLSGFGSSAKEDALLGFYRYTEDKLRDYTYKTRDTLKKFIMTQSLTLTGGSSSLPNYLILGSESTRGVLASIDLQIEDKEKARKFKERALGALAYPMLTQDEQVTKGATLYYQFSALYETPHVLRLIMQRKGLYLSLSDIQAALKEFGREHIPVDDFSLLDVDQIVQTMKGGMEVQKEYDLEAITRKREWELQGSVMNEDKLEAMLSELSK